MNENSPMGIKDIVAGDGENFMKVTEGLEDITGSTPVPVDDGVFDVSALIPDDKEAILNEFIIEVEDVENVTLTLDNGKEFTVSICFRILKTQKLDTLYHFLK